MTVPEIVAGVEPLGLSIRGRASKTVSDALRGKRAKGAPSARTLAVPHSHNAEVDRMVDPLASDGTPESCRSDTGRSAGVPPQVRLDRVQHEPSAR